jgi:hypothetical protein
MSGMSVCSCWKVQEMKAVKPPVSSWRSRTRWNVLDARRERLAHAVHHRRRGAQAVPVRLAHDVEPLVGRALGVGQHLLADVVGEELGAAAGDRLQAGGLQARDHVVEAHPLLLGDELDLRRREGVEVDRRVALAG